MKALARIGVLIATLGGTLAVVGLATPQAAFACSCRLEDDQKIFTGQEDVVLMGTVGPHQGNGVYAFAVERWFHGNAEDAVVPMVSGVQPLPGGGMSVNTCGLDLQLGQRWILAAAKTGEGYSPGACSAHAELGSAYAQEVFAAAVAAFGPGTIPGPQASAPPTPVDAPLPQGFDIVQLGIVVLTPFVAIVVLVLAIGALRHRGDDAEAP